MGQTCQEFKELCGIWSWIGIHPTFSQAYSRCHNHLLGGDGPLPAHHRHFIAIMACTESRCLSLQEEERSNYIRAGGDPTWLDSTANVPVKLRRLATLNVILGSRPWAFNQQHIKAMLTGDGSWSLAELLQAIVILVHFHSSCSYAIGSDSVSSYAHAQQTIETVSTAAHVQVTSSKTAVKLCDNPSELQLSKSIPSARPSDNISSSKSSKPGYRSLASSRFSLRSVTRSHKNKVTVVSVNKNEVVATAQASKEVVVYNNNVVRSSLMASATETGSATTKAAVIHHASDQKDGLVDQLDAVYCQYSPVAVKTTHDSIQELQQGHHLNINDFNWDDHGFSVMSRFYADMSLLLDDKFRVAKQMTYNSYGDQSDVDTSRFRRAVWNYVQMMFGVIHEDFDYSDIDELLSPSINQFIMVAARAPHKIKPDQTSNLLLDLHRSEKAHLSILIVEAKLQALLLYSLRAVMNHMAKR